MSTDQLIRIRIWTKVLLIVAVILFLIGFCVICVPAVIFEKDLNQEAMEYTDLSEKTDTTTAIDDIEPEQALLEPTIKDNPLPIATLVPPLEGTPIQSGDAPTESVPAPIAEENTTPAHADSKPAAEAAIRDLKALKTQNSDFAAWLTIPGTNVDYPVVCSDSTDYYLTHTFSGTKSSLGTLFSLGKTSYGSSKNIAIYGHHITGSGQKMFKPLLSYKDKSFWTEHRTITLDTLSGKRTYTIFAVINMVNDNWDPSTADFVSNDEYMGFVTRAKDQALYDTGVSVSASDRILTLITCDRSYAGKDGRLIVMAVEQ